MANAQHLKCCAARLVGSSPTPGTSRDIFRIRKEERILQSKIRALTPASACGGKGFGENQSAILASAKSLHILNSEQVTTGVFIVPSPNLF